MPKIRVTFWITEECRDILASEAKRVGMPQGALIEQAVRSLANASHGARTRKTKTPQKRSEVS